MPLCDTRTAPPFVCPQCHQPQATLIWVHGHDQCSVCGYVAHPCCEGEAT